MTEMKKIAGESKIVNSVDFDRKLEWLSDKSEKLRLRLDSSANEERLALLRRERELLVKSINEDDEVTQSAQVAQVGAERRRPKSVSRKFMGRLNVDTSNNQELNNLIVNFSGKNFPNLKPFHSRAAAMMNNVHRITGQFTKKLDLGGKYRTDDVIIHVVRRPQISTPHGTVVVVRGDGTFVKKVGVYGKYGRAQSLTVKLDIKGLKVLLDKGAVATPATVDLVKQITNSSVKGQENSAPASASNVFSP